MFSEKYGIRPKVITRGEITAETRNRLLNLIHASSGDSYRMTWGSSGFQTLKYVFDRLGRSHDELSYPGPMEVEIFGEKPKREKALDDLIQALPWDRVLDCLELFAEKEPFSKNNFKSGVNGIFEQDGYAYRFVGNEILELTNDEEILEIEQATRSPFQTANEHIQRSIKALARRPGPDIENSIKESILGVEATVREILKDDSVTLGEGLKQLKKIGFDMHPAFNSAMSMLYGWTSDDAGIRHAISGDDFPVTLPHARYMLISCSAFVNLLAAIGD